MSEQQNLPAFGVPLDYVALLQPADDIRKLNEERCVCGVDDCEQTVPATYSDNYCDDHWYDMEIVE